MRTDHPVAAPILASYSAASARFNSIKPIADSPNYFSAG
jgi:hypothetical protein